MSTSNWTLDQANGTLSVRTGVTGRAARMGHRLTLVMESWRITVTGTPAKPTAAQLVVDVDSLQVVSGEGGLTPLTGPEKAVARGNALKTLDAKRFPTIEFRAEQFEKTADGYLLRGSLQIHGATKPAEVAVTVAQDGDGDGDGWALSASAEVSHKEFGIKPYSMAMGSMKVADLVTVSFTARYS